MEKHLHAKLIDELGGPTAFAKRLFRDDFKQADVGRVHNWKTRGIPHHKRPAVALICKELGSLLFQWANHLEGKDV